MASLIEELQRREAAARREADELRSEIARLSERLARAEETLSRLEVTRETVTEILGAERPVAVRRRQLRPARGRLTARRSGW
jgi:predicted  nucleic acid-binding Zn-ribbon protein